MSSMYRRNLLITTLATLLIGLSSSVTIANGHPWETQPGSSSRASSINANVADQRASQSWRFYSTSIEYEFPSPPPERERDDCASISRLCDWLASHDALIEPVPHDDVDGDPATTGLEVPEANDQTPSNGLSTAMRNRSVVGWNSASISTMQQQQKSAPITLEVPSLSISAHVSGVGINDDRSMEIPGDYNTVGWYRHGPVPGEEGSSVNAGHLDDSRGRSVFYDLQHIEVGATVSVTLENGNQKKFRVFDKRAYGSTNLPTNELFSRKGDPTLTLLTCGGSWDQSAGRYTETVVVDAEPV